MCYFDDGFTELSYFNILKQIVERVYSDAKIDKPLGGLVFRYKVDESINACAYIRARLFGLECWNSKLLFCIHEECYVRQRSI